MADKKTKAKKYKEGKRRAKQNEMIKKKKEEECRGNKMVIEKELTKKS